MSEQLHTIQHWETSDQRLFENFVLTKQEQSDVATYVDNSTYSWVQKELIQKAVNSGPKEYLLFCKHKDRDVWFLDCSGRLYVKMEAILCSEKLKRLGYGMKICHKDKVPSQ